MAVALREAACAVAVAVGREQGAQAHRSPLLGDADTGVGAQPAGDAGGLLAVAGERAGGRPHAAQRDQVDALLAGDDRPGPGGDAVERHGGLRLQLRQEIALLAQRLQGEVERGFQPLEQRHLVRDPGEPGDVDRDRAGDRLGHARCRLQPAGSVPGGGQRRQLVAVEHELDPAGLGGGCQSRQQCLSRLVAANLAGGHAQQQRRQPLHVPGPEARPVLAHHSVAKRALLRVGGEQRQGQSGPQPAAAAVDHAQGGMADEPPGSEQRDRPAALLLPTRRARGEPGDRDLAGDHAGEPAEMQRGTLDPAVGIARAGQLDRAGDPLERAAGVEHVDAPVHVRIADLGGVDLGQRVLREDRIGDGALEIARPARPPCGSLAAVQQPVDVEARQADQRLAADPVAVLHQEELRLDQAADGGGRDPRHAGREDLLLDARGDLAGDAVVEVRLADQRLRDPPLAPGGDDRLGGVADHRAGGRVAVDADPLAGAGALLAVEDVRLRHACMAGLHQDLLDHVLDLFDPGNAARVALLEEERDDAGQLLGEEAVVGADGARCLVDGVGDFRLVELDEPPIPLADPGDSPDHERLFLRADFFLDLEAGLSIGRISSMNSVTSLKSR
jgi:hypothetical protein